MDVNVADDFQHSEVKLSFRRTLLFYLKENANPRLLLKLMQITKFFCSKEFPFFVVEKLKIRHISSENVNVEWKYLPFPLKKETVERIDDTKILKKLWVKNFFYVGSDTEQNLASMILPKIAVCDISRLELYHQIISFNEWMFISKNITDLTMSSSIVKYDDGAVMPLEKYFECSKNIKYVKFFSNEEMASAITKKTAKRLTDLINPSSLIEFYLNHIPDSFDFAVFKKFLKLNKTTAYRLNFIVSQKYKQDLITFIYEMFEANVTEYCPPELQYNGQDWNTFKALCDLQKEYLNKKKKESK